MSQKKFTQAQAQAMHKALQVAHTALASHNYQQHAFAHGYISECLETLQALATSDPVAAYKPAPGRFKLDVFVTGRHIVIEYAQENPYKGQLFPSVDAAKNAITRDYGEHEAEQAAAALNADSTETGG